MVNFLQKQEPISPPVLVLSSIFVAIFVAILAVYVFMLLRDLRKNVPGIRFKLRLVLFFGFVVMLSGAPPLILTANILRNAFDVWFVRDTTVSLSYGIDIALLYYQDKSESLRSFSNSTLLPELVKKFDLDPEHAWERVHEINIDIQAMQIFSPNGQARLSVGDKSLWISTSDLSFLNVNQITKMDRGEESILRAVRLLRAGGSTDKERYVFSLRLARGFESGASLASQTRHRLDDFTKMPVSFQLQVFSFYLMFFVPMILIAFMISFYLADEVIRPLVQLEQAVNKVTQGDYSTRLLARRDETMGHFASSFNDMVGELERSRLDLKQSERLQTWQEIAQRMAHEIKNPLTPIKLSAERILRKFHQNSPEFGTILEESSATIIQEVSAISKLLTEFRDFARLPQPILEAVKLEELILNTWQMYSGMTKVSLDLSDLPQDITVKVDQGQFRQVFKNLFQNAIDAMASMNGGSIQVRAFSIDRMGVPVLRIQIRDEGSGIPTENLKDIFAPYYTSKKTGSGLGLAIVEKIILDHGGRIWVESQPGSGASFFIDLPRQENKDQGGQA